MCNLKKSCNYGMILLIDGSGTENKNVTETLKKQYISKKNDIDREEFIYENMWCIIACIKSCI